MFMIITDAKNRGSRLKSGCPGLFYRAEKRQGQEWPCFVAYFFFDTSRMAIHGSRKKRIRVIFVAAIRA